MMPCIRLEDTPKKCSSFTTSRNRVEARPAKVVSEEPSWLYFQMEQESNLLLIDCRPFSEYCHAHIEGAINLAISDLMLRRLKKGNMPLANLLNSDTSKRKFSRRAEVERIVICDSFSRKDTLNNAVVLFLLSALAEDNRVCFLEGGFTRFEETYPHLCQCGEGNEVGKTMFSLSALKISDGNNNLKQENLMPEYSEMQKEACLYRPDSAGPVEIIPNLFLGNKKDSSDRESLESYKIRYILNVTQDLPNEFEHEDKFSYLKLPVEDNWDGNLFDLFPVAFDFIDKARIAKNNVLVHCVGGISRSSTIVIAYLMLKEEYTLNDAYDYVKTKKSNVAPNFNFMQQLLDFERTRNSYQSPSSSGVSTASASPYSVESSDDSITPGHMTSPMPSFIHEMNDK